MFDFQPILQKLRVDAQTLQECAKMQCEKPIYHEQSAILELSLLHEQVISVRAYEALLHGLRIYTQSAIELKIQSKQKVYSFSEISSYLKYLASIQPNLAIFVEVYPSFDAATITFKYKDATSFEKAIHRKDALKQSLQKYGFALEVEVEMLKEVVNDKIVKKVHTPMGPPPAAAKPMQSEGQKYRAKQKQSLDQFVPFTIDEIVEECHGIKIEGKIFEIETRTIAKTGKDIQTLYVKDQNNAISMKRFERGNVTKEVLGEIKVGDHVRIYGKVEYDMFSRELVMLPDFIEKLDVVERSDDAPLKRVEFHTHTKLSEMDGVSNVTDYISTAAKWGMDAIAICDHAVIQSFPKAQGAMSKVNKGREVPFKVIYGCEMNMVEDHLTIVRNVKDLALDKARYCILDLETTGLSTQYDYITEFGAVIMDGKSFTEEKCQFFVQCPIKIPYGIQKKTNITDEMCASGLGIEEAMDRMVEFIGDAVIIAHNATFDYNFINDVLGRLGRPPLQNPVIDTLDLARSIHYERKAHSLGATARFYNVVYDEEGAHRADYDADVLASVFLKMRNNELEHITTLQELANLQPERAFVKNRERHVTVFAKNHEGLKDLFELISLSHTTYLSYLNKNANTIIATPKITRTVLKEYHERGNLLFGSSCINGEVFDIAQLRSKDALREAIRFYDFIELQPIDMYHPKIDEAFTNTKERLVKVLLDIYHMAKEEGKIIIGSGDVHYVDPADKMIRDIYINSQGVGGTFHPLYIYDEQKRLNTPSIDAHLRTTNEMLRGYPYLSKEETFALVVSNTRLLSEQFEMVYPVKSKLYPPEIEGCADMLRDICYHNAHAIYGEVLPDIVEKRLEKELKSIIGNGFQVVYYISHLLVKKSLDDGYLVGSRGSVGSSFVATMSEITEVNPLAPHYVCRKCHYSEFFENGEVASGFDLPTIACPVCGEAMRGDGQDIPFETFLGFEGDKVPDIDLNFSGEYQPYAHAYTKEVFGEDYVYRAGTIATVAQKTAFGYVKAYQEKMRIARSYNSAQMLRLTQGAEGVKRSTGQHPGGIIVIPDYMDVHDFTPYQYPANDPNAEWRTTHFEFHDIHDNVLKLDILGHVDPTAMKLLENLSGIDPKTIPLNDPEVMAIFSGIDTLKIDVAKCSEKTGAAGIPEFGTQFVRNILELTKPTTFDELVRISGLSHGTDVWLNNAKDLIDAGICSLKDVIGCRDDIMVYLMHKGLPPKTAFDIMEFVRKGKGLKDEWIPIMKEHQVEDWYIDSCRKIKYMFPKAHAVAYVLMAVRIAWFKVHHPQYYYAAYFTLRCDAYDIVAMVKGENAIRNRMSEIRRALDNPETKKEVSKKDIDTYACLELALEMNLRGYYFMNIDIYRSDATIFVPDPERPNYLIPPFTALDGLGESVAKSVVEARVDEEGNPKPFISKQDLLSRTRLSKTHVENLTKMGVLDDFQDENQLSLF